MATPKIRSACAASTAALAPALPCELDLAPRAPSNGTPASGTHNGAPAANGTGSRRAELSLLKAAELRPGERAELFALWQANMGGYADLDYADESKWAEMFDADARYLVARAKRGRGLGRIGPRRGSAGGALLGFASFRFDTEETLGPRDAEVVYCYELQLAPAARKLGLARRLMDELEGIGRRRGMSKAMLTCLVANADGLRFYARQGYVPDEIDPNRIAAEEGLEESYTYRILSKALQP